MSIPSLSGSYIDQTYQRLVQTNDTGTEFADGLGRAISFGGANIPGGPINSLQFNKDNTNFTGSANLTFSGSNTLTLTGSLLISGSTTQVGSNTLLGNTLLSGNIIISGSHLASIPTIKISGDTETDGVIKFLPVNFDIDNTISGSYIFVSGSTDDLYFSQNGAGFSNITRLRWLESNLYTGLLNGGIITATVGSTTYQVSSGSGIVVNLNANANRNPYPTVQYVNWGNLTQTIDNLSGSYDQQFVAIQSNGTIFAQGIPYTDGDYNIKIPIGIVIHQNRSTINAVQTFPSVAYGWKQRSFDFIRAFGPLKIAGYSLSPSGSSTGSLVLSGGTSWVDGRNYIVDPNNPSYIVESTGITTSKIYRYRQSGSGWAYDTNGGAGYATIDPSRYSNNGALSTVPANNWTIQRVFYFPNSATKAFYIYYGNAVYANESDALAAITTETFSEAPNTAANAILVGYMLLRYNADFNTAASYEFYAAGLFRGSGAGGGGGGGVTSPGGSNTQIQYNNGGAFGGVTNLVWNGTTLSATGSFTGSFTGNLQGTSSFATTSSYALNGGVTQISVAGSGLSISPSNGIGQVTITSTGGGGGSGVYGNTATGSYGSFYDTTTQTNPVANTNRSMSLNTTDISNGVTISGSGNPYNTYIKMQNAGVYDIQFSAQLEKISTGNTSTTYIWLRKNGVDVAESNTIVELSQNGKGVAAWNWFVNAAANDYYQIMWSSDRTDIQLAAATPPIGSTVPSLIVTANRVDQFLSNTGSFTGSFTGNLIGTASWANNALTASYILASNVDGTVANATQAISASYSETASYTQNFVEATFPRINLTSDVIDPPGLPYVISIPGIYQVTTAGSADPSFSSYSIVFPDPTTLNGTTITILNADTTYNATIDNPSSLIKNMNGNDVTGISNSSAAIFKAIDNKWWKLY